MAEESLTRRLLEQLRALHAGGWRDNCPAGAPVPRTGGCTAVDCDSLPLTGLAAGRGGTVSCLERPETRSAARLAAMGVLPGARIELVQRWPAFVFRLGRAEFAVDEAMASHIRVHPDAR